MTMAFLNPAEFRIYRAMVTGHRLGYRLPVQWPCGHDHRSVEAAWECGTKHLKRKLHATDWGKVEIKVQAWQPSGERRTSGMWVDLVYLNAGAEEDG